MYLNSELVDAILARLTALRPTARKKRARGDYRNHFRRKPPELKIIKEPWTAGEWFALIVVLCLIAAIVWGYNAGIKQRKWDQIQSTARASHR